MISISVVVAGFIVMVALLFLGLHVATALFLTAVTAIGAYFDGVHLRMYGSQLWSSMEDYILLSIPLYILLGEILVRSGMTDKMYGALAPWLNRLPGSLLHTNIGASAIFSAVSGSSVSTAATITTVALPSFKKRSYDERLVLGSIAAGASLGNLIPPGIAFIIYASLTNTSVGQLYAAAMLPSLILTLLFMAVIAALCLARPELAGAKEPYVPFAERLRRLVDLAGPLVVFAIIMGSVYTGWATVTESAALAVVATMAMAVFQRRLTIRMLHEAFVATASLTAITMLILAVAFYLNYALGLLGITQTLSNWVGSLNADPLVLKWILAIFYLLLGVFFETLPMMVGTVPVLFPIVVAAGIDPVWFGVFIVLMCEMSLLSPPVGMTLYVIQTVRREGNIGTVFAGTIPFVGAMMVMTALLIHFPQMANWAIAALPRQ
ncbi:MULTISPECIES: TRAP transporter large permease [unclassified Chelatococcus]|uniref:TRAP transporter large permease n=1 Tax=unclassified Chelatococcus TaxID=2638111 RepID=UPI001BCAAC98|nr:MULTISPECIES: TRAP transporter large permease [unclassified Chelatococcus]CAH1649075.1 DctM domain-containing protein [Hyphomicrobiales bacterium]MBS7741815.1 TRAP transporter large permease [Chelatococcus sp. HY11]MBX3541387.1 TRAP transporter large permease [Chelatococcus sp.]MCO5074719.1 TRAP transporter large permease [Chelatococcus sp.]CAH1691678.1 DctM domain-containing protein [Hyphomicrobiales bacterium]